MVNAKPGRPKAYSYLRFSTPDQAKGDSQRRQSDAAKQYALTRGLELVDASYEDLGVSAFRGANAESGMLGEFLQAVNMGRIPHGSWLLVESLDRLSRDLPFKVTNLLQSICLAGITVATLSDGKVYTQASLSADPLEFLMAYLVAIRANEESAMKSKRLKAAWANKRNAAGEKKLTSRAPSWLVLSEDRTAFSVVEERADVVRRVYQMFADGVSASKIPRFFVVGELK